MFEKYFVCVPFLCRLQPVHFAEDTMPHRALLLFLLTAQCVKASVMPDGCYNVPLIGFSPLSYFPGWYPVVILITKLATLGGRSSVTAQRIETMFELL